MKMTDRITRRILAQYPDDIALPNFYVGMFEADVWVIRDSGYRYEFEVKVSRADYFADFKNKPARHKMLSEGRCLANKFYFAVPEGLIKAEELPPYAGLFYFKVNDYKRNDGKLMPSTLMTLVKEAKLLHKNKSKPDALARSMYFRKKTLRQRYYQLLENHEVMKSGSERKRLISEAERKEEEADALRIRLMKYENPRWFEVAKHREHYKKYFPEDLEKSPAPPDI